MNKKMMNNDGSSNSSNIEEFSFPVIYNNPLSSFTISSACSSSSSLWRVSSRVHHHQDYYEDKEEEGQSCYDEDFFTEVCSLCEEILPSNRREIEGFSSSFKGKELEVEERMDYLWEGFNEEEKEEVEKERKSKTYQNRNVEYGESFRRSSNKRDGNSGSSRKKLVIIIKLLEGLVSIKKSAHQLKLLKSKF